MLTDFKKFVLRGNVIDMAVGVIVGGAFGKIVSSMVNDILMPPIGKLISNVDFRDLFITLDGQTYASVDAATRAGAPVVKYGQFLNTVLDFLIVAGVIYLVVNKLMGSVNKRLNPEEAAAAPSTKACKHCLSEIPALAKKCRFCASRV